MLRHSRLAVFSRVGLLPLVLIAVSVASLGSYYEASDDTSLAWLFSGALALKPVPSVPLYFHGYGHLLAAAYTWVPAVPWFGLLLGALLSAATVLAFAVLDKLLRPHLRPGPLALALVMFFGLAWLEHWLWFSYVRVALLLAGTAVLFAAQRPGQRAALLLGLGCLVAAWLMRPSLGLLGLAAALPGAVWLAGSWRRAAPVLVGAGAVLALATGLAAVLQTPEEARTQVRDRYFARILDFDQLRPQPRTPADSLGTAAISLWMLGDSTVVNTALFQRAYRFDARDFFGREMPLKLRLRAGLLLRDYFPMLLALAATLLAARVRGRRTAFFWLVQLGFGGVLVLFAGLYKLPPRLELPILDLWLLANLAFLLRATVKSAYRSGRQHLPGSQPLPRVFGPIAGGLALVVVLLYGFKTWHRHQVLAQERRHNELALRQIEQLGRGRIRILAGTNDFLKSLSPFRQNAQPRGAQLMLTGWPAHDASQAGLRQALGGSSDQTECLRRLAARPSAGSSAPVIWVLTPETARWLSQRFRLDGPRLVLLPESSPIPTGSASAVRLYHAQAGPIR